MYRTRTWFLAAALTLTTTTMVACNEAHAGQVPREVDRTARVVRAEGAGIMAWVYPTVTFDKVGSCSSGAAGNGYTLSCRFQYTDTDGEKASRLLTFDLDSNGLIDSIRDGGGSSIVP